LLVSGKEEQGLYGSKAMVRGIKNEEVSQYCAMVNIDSLGMAAPQVAENLSSRPLVDRVTELAQRMKMPFSRVTVPGVGADSIPFIEKKIPAVTISALGNGWSEILHTRNDQVAIVNSKSVYLGYMLALALIGELDNVACDANWKKSNAK
jgi:Iap family predicted aminopeptidase